MSSNDESCSVKRVLDITRYTLSTILTMGCFGFIIYGISYGYASLEGPPWVHFVIFAFAVTLLAYLEGLQVAILALQKVNGETFRDKKRAYTNHVLATARDGINVQRFLVGRQFFVVFVVFLSAQVTTYSKMCDPYHMGHISNTTHLPDSNAPGAWICVKIPKFFYILIIETGMPGILFVLAFGQLMPQLVAATHPITFMNLPGSWFVIQLALLIETIGITHFSWVLTWLVKKIFNVTGVEDIGKSSNEVEMGDISPKGRTPRRSPRRSPKQREYKANEGNVVHSGLDMNRMSIDVLDADALYAGAEKGLSPAKDKDVFSAGTIRWLKDDSIREISNAYIAAQGEESLPTPATIVRHLVQNGQPVPRYLLPSFHAQHIPPHIVAYELLRREDLRTKQNESKKGDHMA